MTKKEKRRVHFIDKKSNVDYYHGITYELYEDHLFEKVVPTLYTFYLCTWPVEMCAGMLPSLGPQTGKETPN